MKPTTLRQHVEILIDSLIASRVAPWRGGRKRSVVSSEKLYLFDTEVTRTLQERGSYQPNTTEYGEAFESLLYHELRCYTEYVSKERIPYRRTVTNLEVDFIVLRLRRKQDVLFQMVTSRGCERLTQRLHLKPASLYAKSRMSVDGRTEY